MTRRCGRLRKLVHDRFARQAVKAVALDAFRLQFPGHREHTSNIRQADVKSGVEARHLRQAGKILLRAADHRQRRRRMQRREGASRFELPQNRSIDAAMPAKLRPAVHDAMPDRVRCRQV